jgi:hypothetical protein
MDLRASITLGDMGICDVSPMASDLDIEDALILAPGAPERSVLIGRVNRRGDDQMPPLASTRIDAAGVSLLEEWVSSLSMCP